MKSIVGVYESHDKAVTALRELKESGYPDGQLSILGKADLIDGHVQVRSEHSADRAHMTIGFASAAVLEIVAIAGILLVPGFGLLFGAGAVVGLFSGMDAALLAVGDVGVIFTGKDIGQDEAERYERNLIEGKFLVFADGDDRQLEQAHRILQV